MEVSKDETLKSGAEFEKLFILQLGQGAWKLKIKSVAYFCEFMERPVYILAVLASVSFVAFFFGRNEELLK